MLECRVSDAQITWRSDEPLLQADFWRLVPSSQRDHRTAFIWNLEASPVQPSARRLWQYIYLTGKESMKHLGRYSLRTGSDSAGKLYIRTTRDSQSN